MNPYEIKYRHLKDAIVKRANELESSNRAYFIGMANEPSDSPIVGELDKIYEENKRVISELWEIAKEY